MACDSYPIEPPCPLKFRRKHGGREYCVRCSWVSDTSKPSGAARPKERGAK